MSCKTCSYLKIALGEILWVTVQTTCNLQEREESSSLLLLINGDVLGKTQWLQLVGSNVSDLLMKFTGGLLCSVFVSSAKLRHKRKEEGSPINGRVTGELGTDYLSFPTRFSFLKCLGLRIC